MNLLENFNLLLYFYLFTVEIVNDFSYKYINFNFSENSKNGIDSFTNKTRDEKILAYNNYHVQTDKLKQTHHSYKHYTKVSSSSSFTSFEFSDLVDIDEFETKFKSILCNNDLIGSYNDDDDEKFKMTNNEACLITLVPCGDINDWHLIDMDLKQEYIIKSRSNNSMLDTTFNGHWELLTNTNQIINRINELNKSLRLSDTINLQQEKKLGNFGYYTSSQSRNSLNGVYLSSFSLKYAFRNNIILNTCDYLEVTLYDSSNNQLMRKQINRDAFEEIKRNNSKYFNIKNNHFINRQQALDLANIKHDLKLKVKVFEHFCTICISAIAFKYVRVRNFLFNTSH